MKKIKTYNYLKKYREQSGFSLQDIAAIIGISDAALSKIEQGLIQPSIEVILAYHHIIAVPINQLFNQHYIEALEDNIQQTKAHREYLLDQKASPAIYRRLDAIDVITSRLNILQSQYD